jgi:C-terminal processing protease CtpA/Prc
VLPLAGLRAVTDTIREARLGIATGQDSTGAVVVTQVLPGGAAEEAGVKSGDAILAIGDLPLTDPNFGPRFRERFGKEEGQALPIQVRRNGQTLTLNGKVRLVPRVETHLDIDQGAPAKAARVREGIFKGTTGP